MADQNQDVVQPDPAHHSAHAILQDPEFQALAKRKNAISLGLTAVMFLVYFGYMGLLAKNHEIVNRPAVGGASLGIPLGIGVIIFTWLLTGVYVAWANGTYDGMVASVKSKMR